MSKNSTAEIVRVDQVNGWALSLVRGEARPRVSHRELAKLADYPYPNDVLALADEALGEDWRKTVPVRFLPSTGKKPLREYFFDRREALEILMLSKKPNAKKLRSVVLDVFEAWLDGKLVADGDAKRRLIALTLRLEAAKSATIWYYEVFDELCKLYKKPVWNRKGAFPNWLAEPLGKIWKAVLGEEAYRELKNRNPKCYPGSLNYQWITDERYQLMKKDVDLIYGFLRTSGSRTDFFAKLRFHYGQSATYQLGFCA